MIAHWTDNKLFFFQKKNLIKNEVGPIPHEAQSRDSHNWTQERDTGTL